MIQLSGIFGESFGGTCTFRGYAKYDEIVNLSYPHPGYQRPHEDEHVDEISKFITSGSNSFSPEVVLAYTTKYDYYAEGASSDVDAISDLRSGRGFSSNVDGIIFDKGRKVGNGFLYTMKIPEKANDTEKPFRRVDGNHRLCAIEKLISEGRMKSSYLIPFCIILFAETSSLKDEKIIFHNINSKAVPIKSEQLLHGILEEGPDDLSFSEQELSDNFGIEYIIAKKILKRRHLLDKLKTINWIREMPYSVIIDIIHYVHKHHENVLSEDDEEVLETALNHAIDCAVICNEQQRSIASGLLFLLTGLYYKCEKSPNCNEEHKYIDGLIQWVEKYQITNAQIDIEENAAINAECIRTIYERYLHSSQQTIFMSRCFDGKYNENENAIRRAIKTINDEKKTNLNLIRVDEHQEGITGQISDRIFRSIEAAGLIIADLSSGRPNVPHEIGYAMGLKKGLILIYNGEDEQADTLIPSNIRMYEQIRVNGDYAKLESEIKKKLIDYYKL